MSLKLDTQQAAIVMGKRHMTQNDLARVSDLSRQTISAVMRGKYCSPITVTKIANALMVPVEALIQKVV